jgi:hypothetical protein
MVKKSLYRMGLILGLAACGSLILLITAEVRDLGKTRHSLPQYRRALENTPPGIGPAGLAGLRRTRAALAGAADRAAPGAGEGTGAAPSIAGAASRARELLKNRSIEPERFRISGTAREETVEFALRCGAVPFFSFLQEASGPEGLVINYLSVKPVPGSSTLDITMRIKNAP